MPNWKKVITSGSNAVLETLTTSGNITVSGSQLAIKNVNQPQLQITDTTNNWSTEISSRNTAFRIDVDPDNLASSTYQLNIDGTNVQAVTTTNSNFKQNIILEKDDGNRIVKFLRNSSTLTNGQAIGTIEAATNFNSEGNKTVGIARFAADGTFSADNYPTRFQIDLNSGSAEDARYTALKLNKGGDLELTKYGSGDITGTAAFTLQVNSSGKVIEGPAGAGSSGSSGSSG